MPRLPRQENPGGIVCLLPDGRVEFLDPAARSLLERHDNGESVDAREFDEFVINSPLVPLERFHLTAPAIAFIETTNSCNLRCLHCYADSAVRRTDEMSTERILRLLDEFEEMGVIQVFLTGGEVFSHRDAVQIIQHARTKSFSTQIFTNGILATEDKLAGIPPGQSFFVSFDTADPVRTVRGKMDFPLLRTTFDTMHKYGHIVRTAISVHRNNIEDALEIFEWCAEHGYPRPQWLETHPTGRALLHPHILLTPAEVDRVFDVYRACMERYTDAPTEQAAPDGDPLAPRQSETIYAVDTVKFCQRLEQATGQEKCGRTITYVSSNGDVYPCSNCMAGHRYGAGNITERSFAEIWRNGFDDIRDITFDDYDACRSCDVAQLGTWCQFRCPPLSANLHGDEKVCGATEYLQQFMLRTEMYWRERRRDNLTLRLSPPILPASRAGTGR
ncbi:radical SAM/SPASM domain-containing protein [Actinacidiphila paucisporea]|uniref:Radical SAM additional 4Fe4S-binding SPASM domain-containing protein n=1 Tax=Actinacidiphila paucisporea TaxID=310782 RepID=A0A1M7HAP5_9ACTN|nr:radical SAM protein [Actinacidiphila paucisporea]SHM25393.1 radical SAM additional 4Fe4S-binding SPASM domain-containing protein [Actinacidiphila paucisporea]